VVKEVIFAVLLLFAVSTLLGWQNSHRAPSVSPPTDPGISCEQLQDFARQMDRGEPGPCVIHHTP
jgi:hypothetical protein